MFFKSPSVAVAAAFAAVTVQGAVTAGGGGGMESPEFPAEAMFNRPLPSPPIAQARFTFTSPETGEPVDYFELEMKAFTSQQYPNLPATPQVGYNGSTPGMFSPFPALSRIVKTDRFIRTNIYAPAGPRVYCSTH